MPEVFATAFLVGLIEGACQKVILACLDRPREQSLGTRVSLSQLAATPPGMIVTVQAEVIAVEGRLMRFRARAHDGRDLVSEGPHERMIIVAARFARRIEEKRTAG